MILENRIKSRYGNRSRKASSPLVAVMIYSLAAIVIVIPLTGLLNNTSQLNVWSLALNNMIKETGVILGNILLMLGSGFTYILPGLVLASGFGSMGWIVWKLYRLTSKTNTSKTNKPQPDRVHEIQASKEMREAQASKEMREAQANEKIHEIQPKPIRNGSLKNPFSTLKLGMLHSVPFAEIEKKSRDTSDLHDKILLQIADGLSGSIHPRDEMRINLGRKKDNPIKAGEHVYYPDICILDGTSHSVKAIYEVATEEMINKGDAEVEWKAYCSIANFYLVIPLRSLSKAKKIATQYEIRVEGYWTFEHLNEETAYDSPIHC
jgi:hypothetical protein